MTQPATAAVSPSQVAHRRPGRGVNAYYLGLELKRQVVSPLTLFVCMLLPVLFYFMFGALPGMDQDVGRGNVNAVLVFLLALYGASMTAAMSAMTVSFERPLGWNRQLHLTPLRPWAYLTTKVINALLGSVVSMALLFVVAKVSGKPQMDGWLWLAGFGVGFVCGATFGALGLLVGSLVRGETATGILVPILLVCCFLSGVFAVPLPDGFFTTMQRIVPLGGAVNLICAMFGPDAKVSSGIGGLPVGDWRIWSNIAGWLLALMIGAALAYRRDTKRQ